MRQAGVIAVLVGIVLASSCGPGGCSSKKTSGRDLVLIEPREAAQLLEGRTKLFGLAGIAETAIVDPRSQSDYAEGHLPGALSMPFQDVAARHDQLRSYALVVVYGSDYGDPRAEAMSKRLIELGIKDVRTMRGGLRAWVSAGYTLERSDEEAE